MMWYEDFAFHRQDSWVRERCARADVIFVQRNILFPELWEAMDYQRGLSKLVVADMDDAYPILPPSNPAHDFWIKNRSNIQPLPLDRLKEGLHHVDALTSPSKQILEDWKHIVPGVWVPNLAPLAWWRNLQPRADDGRIFIGWGGSVSHYDSFWDSGIREALKVLTREYPHVHLMICGNDARLRYKPPAPTEKVHFQIGVPPWLWPQIVSKFDIGIAPLAGEYDRRRSWIKVMEYSLAGVPCAFTKYPDGISPYDDLEKGAVGIGLENSAQNWYSALKYLIENVGELKHEALGRRSMALESLTLLPNVRRYLRLFDQVVPNETVVAPGVTKL